LAGVGVDPVADLSKKSARVQRRNSNSSRNTLLVDLCDERGVV